MVGPEGVVVNSDCFTANSTSCSIDFQGEITRRKVAFIASFLEKAEPQITKMNLVVSIDSNGGDVQAAMIFGRLLRKNEAYIGLRRGVLELLAGRKHRSSVCASSCVLVLAGAVVRNIDRNVFVHRPYGAKSVHKDFTKASSEWQLLQSNLRAYLSEMNVPLSLLDKMNSVPSNEGVRLSDAELAQFMLNQNDPAYVEARESSHASRLGLTRDDYLTRKNLVKQCEREVLSKAGVTASFKLNNSLEYYECERIFSQGPRR
jgi:hypothetical protein